MKSLRSEKWWLNGFKRVWSLQTARNFLNISDCTQMSRSRASSTKSLRNGSSRRTTSYVLLCLIPILSPSSISSSEMRKKHRWIKTRVLFYLKLCRGFWTAKKFQTTKHLTTWPWYLQIQSKILCFRCVSTSCRVRTRTQDIKFAISLQSGVISENLHRVASWSTIATGATLKALCRQKRASQVANINMHTFMTCIGLSLHFFQILTRMYWNKCSSTRKCFCMTKFWPH